MVKAKRRQLATLAANKDNAFNGSDGLNSGAKDDIHTEDDWVIVKKQKVTILIPPLSEPVQLTAQGPSKTPSAAKLSRTVENQQVVSNSRSNGHKKTVALSTKEEFRIDEASPAPIINSTKELPSLTFRTALEGLNQLARESSSRPLSSTFANSQHLLGTCRSSRASMMSGALQIVKKPSMPHSSTLFLKSVGCFNMCMLNKKLQASNLERKLRKAGGLSRWLVSLGLGQFVQMFQRKNMNKFQLLNLTMGKLKDMGADAVGPRRKLIHAIDCLSQPSCFRAL